MVTGVMLTFSCDRLIEKDYLEREGGTYTYLA
jgi:hypothetical protein